MKMFFFLSSSCCQRSRYTEVENEIKLSSAGDDHRQRKVKLENSRATLNWIALLYLLIVVCTTRTTKNVSGKHFDWFLNNENPFLSRCKVYHFSLLTEFLQNWISDQNCSVIRWRWWKFSSTTTHKFRLECWSHSPFAQHSSLPYTCWHWWLVPASFPT